MSQRPALLRRRLHQLPRLVLPKIRHALARVQVQAHRVRPNPSFERTATGKALGPRASQCHHPSRGPSALPASAAQLKR